MISYRFFLFCRSPSFFTLAFLSKKKEEIRLKPNEQQNKYPSTDKNRKIVGHFLYRANVEVRTKL